ncbi:MAG: UDP-N-acetylglucosamine--N-acetylmuramyl-(pentapeptide) pyrophosphoryl-undecaprenol N-acetylglucosamine transferase [Candidatus Berkelbacteria bacterium]
MKIMFTGGGTAGHVWPIVSISQELNKEGIEYLYVGSSDGLEVDISKNYKIPFKGIFVGKFRNYFSLQNIVDPFKILIGLVQAFFIVISYQPDVVFSKGGYVSFPVLFWAKILKIPVVAHESDSVLGRATLWAAKFARKICLGFAREYCDFSNLDIDDSKYKNKFEYTGIPIRKEFSQVVKQKFDRPVILITGGSQGSFKINQIIEEIMTNVLEKFEVFHIVGQTDFTRFSKIKDTHYHVYDFTSDIAQIMMNADLIVSRAGSTLAEISYLGKPSIIIPYTFASMDHQVANAKIYKNNRAAEIVPENHLTGEILLGIINRLMLDKDYCELLGKNAKIFSQHDASKRVVKILLENKKK